MDYFTRLSSNFLRVAIGDGLAWESSALCNTAEDEAIGKKVPRSLNGFPFAGKGISRLQRILEIVRKGTKHGAIDGQIDRK